MKKIIVFIVLVLSTAVIVLSLFLRTQNVRVGVPGAPTPTPVKNPSARFNAIDYSHIFTDTTIEAQVKSVLKNPSGSETQNDTTIVFYPTDIAGRPNTVYEKGGVANYVVQEVTSDNNFLSLFLTAHPNSQSFTLYDSGAEGVGFMWYIFPQDGTAYLANKDTDGYTIRVLYFPPTTKGDFIKTDAPKFQMSETAPGTKDAPESFTQ